MDLEMVRVVLHVPLDGRKQGQAGEQGQKGDRRHCVEFGVQRHPDQSAAPEGRRRGQALDLAFRAEQDDVDADHRGADHGRRRELPDFIIMTPRISPYASTCKILV